MNKVKATSLLETLQTDTRQLLLKLAYLHQLPANKLLQQPTPGRWNVAQVIEHLNTYGRYYLPKLEAAISNSHSLAVESFSPGWLGGYFTRSMKPKPDGSITNKMKAFKAHTPPPAIDAIKALQEFEQQEVWLLDLLQKAKAVNINRGHIPISIAPFITLKMGDVFGFLIAHHQRHFLQIDQALKVI